LASTTITETNRTMNQIDSNIKLTAEIGLQVISLIYIWKTVIVFYLQKCFINHHMKKNTPFTVLLSIVRYCSTIEIYLHERESLRMALLVNNLIVCYLDFNINQPFNIANYKVLHEIVIQSPAQPITPCPDGRILRRSYKIVQDLTDNRIS
jgi:hypothetical protein